MLEAETDSPVAGRGLFLRGTDCHTLTDSLGYFLFQGLPPGQYEIHIGALGYRREAPRVVRLPTRADSLLTFRMRAGNEVTECAELVECAPWLAQLPASLQLSPDEALRASALRLVIGFLASRWTAGAGTLCVDEASPQVRAALHEGRAEAPRISECGDAPLARALPMTIRFGVTAASSSSRTATVHVEYHAGPLDAQGWRCEFVRRDHAWLAQSCHVTWLS